MDKYLQYPVDFLESLYFRWVPNCVGSTVNGRRVLRIGTASEGRPLVGALCHVATEFLLGESSLLSPILPVKSQCVLV